ncbi:tRNA 2-thiocytidine(32) synthetase TtcA [Lachnospiraceae bacterium oral taxon 500]|nr:tRNA 2-thiocytidine(32) synthetase TtcA [Lachnospiraceae bacterium oral taxon 500]
MELQKLYSSVRKAIDTYHMIQANDRIAVAISGGKDSLVLLYALAGLRRFYPQKYELAAMTVSLGFDNFDLSPIQELCASLDVPYHIVQTDIAEVIFDVRQETNPCSLCATMRKGAFNEKLKELGFNKVAYGHHYEDIVETMMLSLFYEGRFNVFPPVTYLDRREIYSIRPLLFTHENDIRAFVRKYNVPVVKSPCPADGNTKRAEMKALLKQINETMPGLYKRLFHAIQSSDLNGWAVNKGESHV